MTDSDILSAAAVPLRVADLLQAAELTRGDRNASYGDPVENYRHTVAVFNAITGRDLTAREGALFMVAVKLARLRTAPRHTDSHVDAMAYLGIVHECAEAERVASTDDVPVRFTERGLTCTRCGRVTDYLRGGWCPSCCGVMGAS